MPRVTHRRMHELPRSSSLLYDVFFFFFVFVFFFFFFFFFFFLEVGARRFKSTQEGFSLRLSLVEAPIPALVTVLLGFEPWTCGSKGLPGDHNTLPIELLYPEQDLDFGQVVRYKSRVQVAAARNWYGMLKAISANSDDILPPCFYPNQRTKRSGHIL